MVQAAQAKQELYVTEVKCSAFWFILEEDMLPKDVKKDMLVFSGDDLDGLFPGKKNKKLRKICIEFFQAERCGVVDYIKLERRKKGTLFYVQPVVGEPVKSNGRVDAALRACGYLPIYAIEL